MGAGRGYNTIWHHDGFDRANDHSGANHWAIVATLIQTAKLNDIEPLAWLTDVLHCIVSGQTKQNDLQSLLPWNWNAKTQPQILNSA